MQPTIEQFKALINDPTTRACVDLYLVARAAAETMRAAVDEVWAEVLAADPVPVDPKWNEGSRRATNQHFITGSNDSYLAPDYLWPALFAKIDAAARAKGIKPADMDTDHCPALVAESEFSDARRTLIYHTAPQVGIEPERLYYSLDKMKDFAELIAKAVVNSPDFVNPLKKYGAK
jgi:hypothetical protein